ncbi:MAG: DUF2279 domain-containing protein, partial [Phycisphaerae bacterium]|nr:DUF2279 domain-containing protein [Phycisphaerae bacterium]
AGERNASGTMVSCSNSPLVSGLGEEESSPEPPWWPMADWPREKKVVALNLAAVGTIAAVGSASWDYANSSFTTQNEGWFGHDTRYGGADKLGHAFGAYSLTAVYSSIYRHWGYSDDEAMLGGVLSSWSLMTLTEIGDGFSDSQGFSWEDEVMNTVGVGIAYLRHRYPSLKEMVDFRLEWFPSPALRHGGQSDPFTDYSGQKYLLAFKPDGLLKTDNPLLKATEIHFGYYTRGYGEDGRYFSGESRYSYLGVGLNVTYLLELLTGHRAGGVFDYIQVPYTYLSSSSRLD